MKTWKPDTCDCVVEEIYNGTQIVGGGAVIHKCSVHSTVPDVDLYGVLYSNPNGENKMKNHLYRIAMGYSQFGDLGLTEELLSSDGSTYLDFKKGITVDWVYSGTGVDRVLTITIVGYQLSTPIKTSIADYCTTTFGVGKVVLVN